MDVFSKKKRSQVMSAIKGTDTKFEVLMRKLLFSLGYRFRKNVRSLPGTPDIVLPKYKTVVLINGCFWHGHANCKYFKIPKSRISFWENKIKENKLRDSRNFRKLKKEGWQVLLVWECSLKRDFEGEVIKLVNHIESSLLD